MNQSSQNVTALDPVSGAFSTFPVGGPAYTYSDFTGNLLRTFTAPQGIYREVIVGCFGNPVLSWANIIWNATMPGDTAVSFRARVASSIPGLQTALWFPDPDTNQATLDYFATSPANISGLPAGGTIAYIEIEAVLESDEGGLTPTLLNVQVSRNCEEL
ncbi:MAG: hypothetical protein R3C68_08015 [Myxococcota bacterium]